jgi:hypothetical protein
LLSCRASKVGQQSGHHGDPLFLLLVWRSLQGIDWALCQLSRDLDAQLCSPQE